MFVWSQYDGGIIEQLSGGEISWTNQHEADPTVVYFDQLSGAARTQKLVETYKL